jgi:hypothetical protein
MSMYVRFVYFIQVVLTCDYSVMMFTMTIVELFNDAKRPRIRFMPYSLFYLIILETVIY